MTPSIHSRPSPNKKSYMPDRPYGYICGGCLKRYGEPQRGGYIDLKRCEKCPRFSFLETCNGRHN